MTLNPTHPIKPKGTSSMTAYPHANERHPHSAADAAAIRFHRAALAHDQNTARRWLAATAGKNAYRTAVANLRSYRLWLQAVTD